MLDSSYKEHLKTASDRDYIRASHENRQFFKDPQDPRQKLPRHPPPRPRLCDQQEKPALQGAPGLILKTWQRCMTLKKEAAEPLFFTLRY